RASGLRSFFVQREKVAAISQPRAAAGFLATFPMAPPSTGWPMRPAPPAPVGARARYLPPARLRPRSQPAPPAGPVVGGSAGTVVEGSAGRLKRGYPAR